MSGGHVGRPPARYRSFQFSKRHYVALAAALLQAKPTPDQPTERFAQWLRDCRTIAGMCGEDNVTFDHARFWRALKAREPK